MYLMTKHEHYIINAIIVDLAKPLKSSNQPHTYTYKGPRALMYAYISLVYEFILECWDLFLPKICFSNSLLAL